MTELVAHPGPEWVVAEMPAGYQTRLSEIQRLMADLQEMGRFARMLWNVGQPLGEAARDAFTALKFDAQVQHTSPSGVIVRLDGKRRLLVIHPPRPRRSRRRARSSRTCSGPCRRWPRNPIAWSS